MTVFDCGVDEFGSGIYNTGSWYDGEGYGAGPDTLMEGDGEGDGSGYGYNTDNQDGFWDSQDFEQAQSRRIN